MPSWSFLYTFTCVYFTYEKCVCVCVWSLPNRCTWECHWRMQQTTASPYRCWWSTQDGGKGTHNQSSSNLIFLSSLLSIILTVLEVSINLCSLKAIQYQLLGQLDRKHFHQDCYTNISKGSIQICWIFFLKRYFRNCLLNHVWSAVNPSDWFFFFFFFFSLPVDVSTT